MKKIKCKVCGKRIRLDKIFFYPVLKDACVTRNEYMECFDCPNCGRQNVVGIRFVGKAKKRCSQTEG